MADSSIFQPSIPSAQLPQAAQQGNISNLSGISPVVQPPRALQAIDPNSFTSITEQLAQAAAKTKVSSQRPTSLNIYGVNRLPWIFSTFQGVAGLPDAGVTNPPNPLPVDPKNSILWVANPKTVSWQINQRGSESKNKSGTVLHIWHDRFRNSPTGLGDYDDPKIILTFQAGNILPQPDDATNPSIPLDNNGQVPGGLNNFYQFLNLVDQPKIASNGAANVIHILYRSRIFPSLLLTGFFDPQMVVQFTDDSQNPNTVNSWTASFTIYSTTPKLNSLADLLAQFKAEGFNEFPSIGSNAAAAFTPLPAATTRQILRGGPTA